MKKLEYILCWLLVFGSTGLFAQKAPISRIETPVTAEGSVVVPVLVSGFNQIAACNLKIAFDENILKLTGVTIGPDVAPAGNIDYNATVAGQVYFQWFGNPAADLPDGSVAFNLHFDRVTYGTSPLTFVDDNQSRSCRYYQWDAVNQRMVLLNDEPSSTYYSAGSATFIEDVPAPVTTIPALEACPGQKVSFPVTVSGFNNVGAASFEIAYDPAVLTSPELVNTSNVLPLGFSTLEAGKVRISGYTQAAGGASLADNAVLFTLSFTYQGGTSNVLFVHTSATTCQYGGAAPGFNPLFDTPKSHYFVNGGIACKPDVPVIATIAESKDLGLNPVVQAPVFTGTDVCDGTFVPVATTQGPQVSGCTFTQSWVASYTNTCGAVAVPVSVTYTWTTDTEPPTATQGTIADCYKTAGEAQAAALTATTAMADNCTASAELAVTAEVNGTCSAVVTVTITDKANNKKEITYQTRIDNTAPQFTCVATPFTRIFPAGGNGYTVAGTELDPTGVTDNCEGTLTITHNLTHTTTSSLAGYRFSAGTSTVVWTLSDRCGNSATCSIPVGISEEVIVKNNPVAVDDLFDTEMNSPVSGNVTTNDYDPDGDPLTVTTTPVTAPANGTVVLSGNGQFTYTPRLGFVGDDHFEYRICDPGGLCDVGRVTIRVAGCDLFVPNGFSPNGDGINDYFDMICLRGKYNNVRIEIFNRWGQIVYQKDDYGNIDRWGSDAWWDGRSNKSLALGNNVLPTGTYFYVLFLNDGNDPVTGAVFLNR
jgi:gliding motility-associated-like protein